MKRFTETEKWNDSWFMSLTGNQKLAWIYLTDRCDSCGVWDRNDALANCQIGSPIDWDEALKAFGNGRVRVLPSGKWLILPFIAFQYGKLSNDCAPHKGIIARMKSHGLTPLGLAKGKPTLKEKERDKEEEKDKEKENVSKRRPTIDELLLHGAKIGLPESEVHKFFNFYESKGWLVGKTPMRSYPHSMALWKRNWQERQASLNGRPMGQQTLIDKELDRL